MIHDWIFSRRLSARILFPVITGFFAAAIGYLSQASPHSLLDAKIAWVLSTILVAIVKEVTDWLFMKASKHEPK